MHVNPNKEIFYTLNIGSSFGNAAVVTTNEEFTIAWNVLRLQPRNHISSSFLAYLLNEPTNKARIKGLNSSSTMPFVSGKELGKVDFNIPPSPSRNALPTSLAHSMTRSS